MSAVDDPWAPLTPGDVSGLLSGLPIRWWIAGGWALDVEGRKQHQDIDVAVLRPDHETLRDYLDGWDLRVAYAGVLTPWTAGAVGPPENGVWARPGPGDAWHIDFKIELLEGDEWVFRRDPSIRRPVTDIGVVLDGIPYLVPDIARRYKDTETTN